MDIKNLIDDLDELVVIARNDENIGVSKWLQLNGSVADVKELLEKQLKDKWVPVSEGLPEDYGIYLVAWRPVGTSADDIRVNTESDLTHYYEMLEFDPNDESGWLETIQQCKSYEILAWKTLPDPYKGKSNEG